MHQQTNLFNKIQKHTNSYFVEIPFSISTKKCTQSGVISKLWQTNLRSCPCVALLSCPLVSLSPGVSRTDHLVSRVGRRYLSWGAASVRVVVVCIHCKRQGKGFLRVIRHVLTKSLFRSEFKFDKSWVKGKGKLPYRQVLPRLKYAVQSHVVTRLTVRLTSSLHVTVFESYTSCVDEKFVSQWI
jgi:hypothetical protein